MFIEVVALVVGGVSLLVGVGSIVLALVAIHLSRSVEKSSQENFGNAKDALSEVREKAALIETVVSDNQRELQTSMTNLLTRTVLPDDKDQQTELMARILQSLLANPQALEAIERLGQQQHRRGAK